jgi:AcrR family transcriptional regulator
MRRSGPEAVARILEAAEAEFTRFGVIGARIDRIAREAHASKERLYAYFGDKQGLFDRVIHNTFVRFDGAVRIEHDDLVTYAGRLVDHFTAHPEDLRLLGWTRVDEQCEEALRADEVIAHHAEKTAAVRRAQAAGRVDPTWDPDELLKLILALATYWASASDLSGTSPSVRRANVEEAVRRLVEPKPTVEQHPANAADATAEPVNR